MKKINLNKTYRLEEIRKLALLIQNTKLKSLTEIRKIAESIEILSNDKILKGLNKSMDDYKKGRFIKIESGGKE